MSLEPNRQPGDRPGARRGGSPYKEQLGKSRKVKEKSTKSRRKVEEKSKQSRRRDDEKSEQSESNVEVDQRTVKEKPRYS